MKRPTKITSKLPYPFYKGKEKDNDNKPVKRENFDI